ncbi:class I SAM-dependent DNA methyltransferase [Prochlorococcus marinus]|uniref:class I SAM-dependent DNA methyltransferase n=1 Tax=Prochlorococcus marinus TaxID=1219 RepID=UPI0022B3619E|nr:DNA methyltransferase [Prochlorococcus marinus]
MNAVEIEEEVSSLATQPFDANTFSYDFLSAFGIKSTTIKKLRTGISNKSDLGGILLRNNIHISVCAVGKVNTSIFALKESLATKKNKVKYVLATDGKELQAEDLNTGDFISCEYSNFPDHFGFFLSLAGISSVKQINENAFDVRATGRLNKLYVELLKENPDWGASERREEMNHFMARIIFCFFAEDTDIFGPEISFTKTIEQMSEKDSSNTSEIISEVFRSMNIPKDSRQEALIPRWADVFPYVNGGLFSGSFEVPFFSKIARSYLIHIGNLDWKKINPDIFGSMIQVIADEEERGFLGMHYTSLPNILKVLNPLFLDDLRSQLQSSGDNDRKLINLRKRISKIRVFDPACGSGNFLVIAYKEMRNIEDEVNRRRNEIGRKSDIPLTNFRGIEIRNFSTEIARLALIIAEYQCNVLYLGQKEALVEFLPLEANNWITCGNALRLNWSTLCPNKGRDSQKLGDNLFDISDDRGDISFKNDGGETYICGNPPYVGLSSQTDDQKADLKALFEGRSKYLKSFDYVMGWFFKANEYIQNNDSKVAFVSTNSICQGQLVPMFWPLILKNDIKIFFAYTSFKWSNLAAKNAGVTVVILGLSKELRRKYQLFGIGKDGKTLEKLVENINPYLVPAKDIYIEPIAKNPTDRPSMIYGNKATDGGNLIVSQEEARRMVREEPLVEYFLKPYFGSAEFINNTSRVCIWVDDNERIEANQLSCLNDRFNSVAKFRSLSKAKETRQAAEFGYRFRQIQGRPGETAIIIPRVSSEMRAYIPVGLLSKGAIISDSAFAIYEPQLWAFAILSSRLHMTWVSVVCGKLETRLRYSNTLGWNTFPLPFLTEKNKIELSRCSENILLARENYFPTSISQLYDVNQMPDDLLNAHKQNDEVLERIYIGRCFKNDTERLEKLFQLYVKSNSLKYSKNNIKDKF